MGHPMGPPHGTPMGPPKISHGLHGLPVRPPSNSRNLIDYPLPSKSGRKTPSTPPPPLEFTEPHRLPPLEIVPENSINNPPPRIHGTSSTTPPLEILPPLEFTEPHRLPPPRNRAGKLHVPFLTQSIDSLLIGPYQLFNPGGAPGRHDMTSSCKYKTDNIFELSNPEYHRNKKESTF